jgi:hypothetical protein
MKEIKNGRKNKLYKKKIKQGLLNRNQKKEN